jgi:hypothetical protein
MESSMKRDPRFQPRLDALEDRWTPSTVPFKESLTFLDQAGLTATYAGKGTHLGKVSAVEYFNPAFDPSDPESVFATYVKTTANGATLFGRVIPDDPANPFTTGDLTIDGGTGRFAAAAGTSDYVVSVNNKTGATTVKISGTISFDARGSRDTQVVPFQVNGGGPAPGGLPLFPGGTAQHSATGIASQVGNYTGDGTFELVSINISPTGAVTGTFEGSFVFVAPNGDKLAFDYGVGGTGVFTGQVSADGTRVENVTFDAIFTPDPANSTGRFANVTGGSFRMIANAPSISLVSGTPGFTAPFNYTWSGEGFLTFDRSKK